jgi:DNA-binding transcriptional MocR family regulator
MPELHQVLPFRKPRARPAATTARPAQTSGLGAGPARLAPSRRTLEYHKTKAADILIVTGVAQALALLARVLRARGLSEIAVEDPGSRACAGSTPKTLAPGMRLGWLAGPDTDLAEGILRTRVLVHPLTWHRQRPGVPGILLGYAAHTPDQLHEATRRIAHALTQATA